MPYEKPASRELAEGEVRRFLLATLPKFVAPTDAKAWTKRAAVLRREALAKVYMKGWSPSVVNARPRVVWGETLRPDPAYTIRKLRYEACPDYWVPCLLYEPAKLRGKVPVVINPNGHHAGGKAAHYKQIRCANLARRGVIAMSPEFVGMGELQADRFHNNQAHLHLTGMSGVGLMYLALRKGLDVLLAHKHADLNRVGCTGLSGGGWQTIVLSALDTRITLIVPVAGYTALRTRVECTEDRGDLEQMPPDMATVLDYQDMTAMLAPRPLLQIMNEKDDCCFRTGRTKPVIYDALLPTYRAFAAEGNIAWHSNHDPGTHNYGADNRRVFYRFLNRHWALDAPEHDIHALHDVLPESALNVGLPPEQKTMLTLALDRELELAKRRRMPKSKAQRLALRKKLAEVVRLPRYEVEARKAKRSAATAAKSSKGVERWELPVGPWTVVLSGRLEGAETVELVVEDGDPAAHIKEAVPGRVWVEPLGTGTRAVSTGLLTLLESAGERVLGIQAAQILAAARWVRGRAKTGRINLAAHGTASAMAALVAAALEPGLFARLTVTWETMRLRYLLEWPTRYDEGPGLFCPGLLAVADVPELLGLLESVELVLPGRETAAEPGGPA